ncbi:aminopeptidase P family protein [Aminobacter anthyllidis]|uniref:Aminopeptidase P family protein n=1 Tax=Aminobacter anthyllidis TaxID=1035067 RepID=A0A9X1D922_9HYPH|nr:Xaa-Pro peptidase family protein [Aminobacter anthyllidis]MBT1159588.1 aminopeptidase P family protein [Aminobacter anthyllidis]
MNYDQYIEELATQVFEKELSFSESEYRLRLERVRNIMDEKGLDVLLVTFTPNLSYLSGYQSFGSGWYKCMVLPREGEPILHMHQLEVGPALLTSWVKDIRSVPWTDSDGMATGLADILKERRQERKRIGLEIKKMGLGVELYEGLKRALPNAVLVDASDVVAQPRMVKSSAEVDYMRSSAGITIKALDTVLPMIKAGVTDNQIAAVIYQTLVNEGSEYFSTQPIVSAGQRNWFGHTTFRRTALQEGDTAALEFGAAYQRYTSAVFHTVSIGKPSPLVEKRAKVINETLDLLFQVVKPGRSAHDVAREIGAGMDEISPVPSSSRIYGYSIGLGFPPTWGEELYFIREGAELELKAGMTFHSPLVVDKPGTPAVGFSETWVVTETGCEILTVHDRELTVVEE